MSTIDQSTFDINALLDGTLDDLADAPEFKPFPAGTHKVTIKLEQKKIGTHPAIEATFVADETIELADSSDTPLSKGASTSIAFLLDKEFGQGDFKKVMKAAAEKFGAKANRDLMNEIQGCEVLIITGLRSNTEKTRKYTTLVDISVI